MSRIAYESYFGKAAPIEAVFGVDISFFQATWDGNAVDYSAAAAYAERWKDWAQFVCMRVSYGRFSKDESWPLHMQVHSDLRLTCPIGAYHFANFGDVNLEAQNFIAEIQKSHFDFLMLDLEAAGGSTAWVTAFCDIVKNTLGRDIIVYSNKGWMDNNAPDFGARCPYWGSHYASAKSNPMVGTTDWNSWDAPLIPNQYANQGFGIWQWQSLTAQHGHLDLNISIHPELVNLAKVDPDMAYDDTDKARLARVESVLVQTLSALGLVEGQVKFNQVPEQIDSLIRRDVPALDVDGLAKAIVAKLPPSSSGGGSAVTLADISAAVRKELGKALSA